MLEFLSKMKRKAQLTWRRKKKEKNVFKFTLTSGSEWPNPAVTGADHHTFFPRSEHSLINIALSKFHF